MFNGNRLSVASVRQSQYRTITHYYRITMKFYKLAVIAACTAVFATACSDSNSPEGTGTVEMGAQVTNSTVAYSGISKDGGAVQGGSMIDSVTIDRVRILLSRLKFKRSDEDTSGGKDVKTGPAVVVFEDGTIKTIFKEPIPVGTYDRVKLEKHKFSSKEADQYKDDPTFGDFAYPEKLTLIIDGSVWTDGEEKPFTFTDDATENLWINFEPSITVEEGQTTTVDIYFDGKQVFLADGTILDPFIAKDRGELSKNLKKAFKILKRLR